MSITHAKTHYTESIILKIFKYLRLEWLILNLASINLPRNVNTHARNFVSNCIPSATSQKHVYSINFFHFHFFPPKPNLSSDINLT